MIPQHKWSAVSLAISVGAAAALFFVTQYLYRVHGTQDFSWLSPYGECAVIASVVTGLIAARKEKSSAISWVAILVGAFSLLFYTV